MEFKTLGLGLGIMALVLFVFLGSQLSYETAKFPDVAVAATTTSVTVTADVASSLGCFTNTSSTVFGTLTSDVITTSSPNTSSSLTCANSPLGCTLYVKDIGSTTYPGLWASSISKLIASPNAAYSNTATLLAGTEGYGIYATTTAEGTGSALNIPSKYKVLVLGTSTVGGLLISNTVIASSTATISARSIITTHKAAIAVDTPGGSYTDSITYECTAN